MSFQPTPGNATVIDLPDIQQHAVTLNGTVPASAGGCRVVTTGEIYIQFGASLTAPQTTPGVFMKLMGRPNRPYEGFFSLASTVNSAVVYGNPGTGVDITLGTFESP